MLCPRAVPPMEGGAERVWRGIHREINAQGHLCDLVMVDSPEASFADVVGSYVRFDALDLSAYDLVITTKYPAWMVKHPRKVVYMFHPLRGLYDTYAGPLDASHEDMAPQARALLDTITSARPGRIGDRDRVLDRAQSIVRDVPGDHPDVQFPGPLIRELVHWLDRDALDPVNTSNHMAISRTVARRPGYFPDPDRVEVVVPPSSLLGLGPGEARHLFTASRLDGPKRIDLVVDSMAFIDADVELRIAGTGPLEESLRARATHDPRVRFLGFVGDDQLVREYGSAIAVPFVPTDEDLGLVGLESQMSHKPVVTCLDSGGTAELVTDGVDGFVVAPTAREIGRALDRLVRDRPLALAMGERGYARASTITWRALVDALLDEPRPRGPRAVRRPRIVALSTYPAEPARHGGQVRLNRLLRSLAHKADVHLLAVDSADRGPSEVVPSLLQTTAKPDPAFASIDLLLTAATGVPSGDLAAALAPHELGRLSALVAEATAEADAVVLAHPYLFPLVRDSSIRHIVYDAHNVEFELKSAMYATTADGRAAAEAVREVELAAVRAARLITAVSDDDIAVLRDLCPTLADFALIPNGGDVRNRMFLTGEDRRARRDAFLEAVARNGNVTSVSSIALFVGSNHSPNVDAAIRILEIARTLPTTLFVLVGSHVDALPGIPTGTNVIARGVVDDAQLDQLLSCCDVALNPMDSGSGTNIKMLDYFAAGVPVVSTTLGARGLGATAGVHYREAGLDTLDAAVLDVLDHPSVLEGMTRAARTLAEASDWAVLGERFTDALLGAI